MTPDNANGGLIPAERPQPGAPGTLTRLPERPGGYGYGYGYGYGSGRRKRTKDGEKKSDA